jgi:hypothetical protein
MMEQESDSRIKGLWELHLNMELTHLQNAIDLLRRYEGREPEEIGLPPTLPVPVTFESNKEYVRQVLASQVDMTTDRTDYGSDRHRRYDSYQTAVNEGLVPSEAVIDQHREKFGHEYRLETEGQHPIERLREPQAVS